MAIVIVVDHEGHERMRRNTNESVLKPPPGWDEAKWTGTVVTDLIRTLDREEAEAATNKPSIIRMNTPNEQFIFGPYEKDEADRMVLMLNGQDADCNFESESLVTMQDAGLFEEGSVFNV